MAQISETDLRAVQDAIMSAQAAMRGNDNAKAQAALLPALATLTTCADHMAGGALVEAASALHACDDIEIDDDAGCSQGEGGAWVQAWVWVPQSDPETSFTVYQDDAGKWHAEEIEDDEPTGYVIGPFETEALARIAGEELENGAHCATCYASTETRALPCDECGHRDGED